MKKKTKTVKPDAQCRCDDPLPKDWKKLFRKVTRGRIRAGDILDLFPEMESVYFWADGMIGEQHNALGVATYRRIEAAAESEVAK